MQAIESWPTNPEPYVVAGDSLMSTKLALWPVMVWDEETPEDFYESALLHELEKES